MSCLERTDWREPFGSHTKIPGGLDDQVCCGNGGDRFSAVERRRSGVGQAPQHQIEHQVDIMILQGAPQTGAVAPPVMAGGPDIEFISMPLGLGGETVTGAPYSAEAVTVVAQTLADGNRISRESKAAVYRDTAGRTRREQGLAIIGAMVGGPEDRQQVHITDPQAGVTYILDMGNRTAHKTGDPQGRARPGCSAGGRGWRRHVRAAAAPAGVGWSRERCSSEEASSPIRSRPRSNTSAGRSSKVSWRKVRARRRRFRPARLATSSRSPSCPSVGFRRSSGFW